MWGGAFFVLLFSMFFFGFSFSFQCLFLFLFWFSLFHPFPAFIAAILSLVAFSTAFLPSDPWIPSNFDQRQESVESCRMLWPSKVNRVNRNNVTLRSWEIWRGACGWPVSSGSVSSVKQFSVHVSTWTNHFWCWRRESAGEQVCSWLIIFL